MKVLMEAQMSEMSQNIVGLMAMCALVVIGFALNNLSKNRNIKHDEF
jgi:glucose uptake protein GlcU